MADLSAAAASKPSSQDPDVDVVNLRDPYLAAILAWLIPGLGHWYQGRRSKAVLLFVCIMGTFAYGLYLGEGRVVYASFRTAEDKRLSYLAQIGVGAPALPALVQSYRFGKAGVRAAAETRIKDGKAGLWDWFMVPPSLEPKRDDERGRNAESGDYPDELDQIHYRLNRRFELGTMYTVVAGLLNVLAIFDAFGGPAYGQRVDSPKKKDDERTSDTKAASETSA